MPDPALARSRVLIGHWCAPRATIGTRDARWCPIFHRYGAGTLPESTTLGATYAAGSWSQGLALEPAGARVRLFVGEIHGWSL